MAFLMRGLLFYLAFAIAIAMWQPQVVFGTNGNVQNNNLLSWYDVHYNSSTGSMYMASSSLQGGVYNATYGANGIQTVPNKGSQLSLNFLDPVFQIFGFLGLILQLLMSPLSIIAFGVPGIPFGIVLIIGLVPTFLVLLSVVFWIRSGVV
jgi:hypothetical protein